MLVRNMKNLIKYAIELDIDYLETFLGYQGDKVLKIITKNKSDVEHIKKFADNLELNYKVSLDDSSGVYGTYIIYIGVEDESIFKIKRD